MRMQRSLVRRSWKLAATCLAGSLLAGGCSGSNLQLVAIGLQAALNAANSTPDDDISLGDWLASELSDNR